VLRNTHTWLLADHSPWFRRHLRAAWSGQLTTNELATRILFMCEVDALTWPGSGDRPVSTPTRVYGGARRADASPPSPGHVRAA
jgi:hypothetical protein